MTLYSSDPRLATLDRIAGEFSALRTQGGDLASDLIREAIVAAYPSATGYRGGADFDDGEVCPFISEVLRGDTVLATVDECSDDLVTVLSDLIDWVADPAYAGGSWTSGVEVTW